MMQVLKTESAQIVDSVLVGAGVVAADKFVYGNKINGMRFLLSAGSSFASGSVIENVVNYTVKETARADDFAKKEYLKRIGKPVASAAIFAVASGAINKSYSRGYVADAINQLGSEVLASYLSEPISKLITGNTGTPKMLPPNGNTGGIFARIHG